MSLRIYHRRHPRLDPRQKPPLGARLDPEHPLSKGLVLCLLFNEGMGNRISDLTNPNLSAVKTGSGSFSWEGDAFRTLPDESGIGAYFNFGNQQRHRGLTQKTIAVAVCNLEDVWRWILTKGYDSTDGGWALGYHRTMGRWMHSIRDSEGTYRYNYFGPAPIGEWTHVVATYDAALPSGNMRGYVNGEYRRSVSCPGVVLNSPNALMAFADESPYLRYFNGLVKYIRLYNRALTDDEIAWLYAEPYAGLLPPTSRRIYSYSSRPRVHHVHRPRIDPRQKPPLGAKVDWAHQLNEGLQCCLLFNEGAGRPADIARPGLARNHYPIMWKPRDRGVTISDNIFRLDHQIKYPVREVTIVIRVFYHTPNTQKNRNMVRKYSGTANGNYWLVLQAGDDEGCVVLYANAGGVWGALTILPGGKAPRLTIGAWNDVVATYSPKTGGKIYINGRLVPSSVVGPKGELYQNAIDPIVIGGGNTSCYDSDFLAIYDRELSPAEIAWLYAEPYAGLLPPTSRRVYPYSRRGIIRARAIDGTPFGGAMIR